ncbi:hypothetical protein RND81_09G257200 [Saponaria officinalis]|uniref:Uncharacterized protein n=1 Tax=Saponaria officinalis TaxID=3572 RepID=A0AAW1IR56_SAPOF
MVVDPIGFIEAKCFISPSQQSTLSTAPFVRFHDFFAAAVDDLPWPESSDDDADVTLPVDDVVTIRFCSAPSSPELVVVEDVNCNRNDVELGISDEVGFSGERMENFASPPLKTVDDVADDGDDVSGVENGVELGFSGERRMMMEKSAPPPSAPPMTTADDVADDDDGMNGAQYDVESGICEDVGFSGERKKTVEELAPPSPPNNVDDGVNGAQNDVESGNFEELRFSGVRKGSVEKSASPSPPLTMADNVDEDDNNANGAQNDVELAISDELGFNQRRKRARDDTGLSSDELAFPPTAKKSKLTVEDTDVDHSVGECDDVVSEEKCENDLKNGGKSKIENDLKNGGKSSSGNAMKYLIEMLRILGENQKKLNQSDDDDFLETAKRRGYTFPQPRRLG